VVNPHVDAEIVVLVLFAASGVLMYKLVNVQPVIRVTGATELDIIDKLNESLSPIACLSWPSSYTPFTDEHGSPAEVNGLNPTDISVVEEVKHTIMKQQVELNVARKLIAQLMHTPDSHNDVPVIIPGDGFTTYDREIRGFMYEFSDDFRPDRVCATKWDANLLYKYLYKNKSDPHCVFPRIVRFVSCTPRYGSNCDFGVLFEHPVSKALVHMEMCKAFALVCTEYRVAAFAYESFAK
jgi:hypothetical protein